MRRACGAVLALLLLSACGPSRPVTRRTAPAPAEPAPQPVRKAVRWDGPFVALGQEFAIVGWNAVGVRGADMVIYLRATDWSEISLERETVREGSAQLTVTTPDGDTDLDVEIGGTAEVGGYVIECRDAADAVDDNGRTVPTARLYVRRPAK
jgi:hypothetical protein